MKVVCLVLALFLASCGIAHQNYLRIGGEGRPEWKQSPLPLQSKAEKFQKDLSLFISPFGTLIYMQGTDGKFRYSGLSDVCDWTGACLGMESIQFAVTQEPAGIQRIEKLLSGLETLHRVTGVRGLFARNAIPPGSRVAEGNDWFDGLGDMKGWRWKGDVSKDQYSGALFGLSLAWEFSGDEKIRSRVAALASAIADHLIEHEYYLTDAQGESTTYGNLNARIAWFIPIGVNALISLSALKLAAISNSDTKYQHAYLEKVDSGWDSVSYWAKFQIFGKTNHNNDNMAFLCYYPLLRFEKDPEIRRNYLNSLKRSWSYVYKEGNAFFTYVAAAFDIADGEALDDARVTLELFPVDRRIFTFDHSQDERFEHAFFNNRKGRLKSKYPIPINYRSPSAFAWKTDPYELVSGDDVDAGKKQFAAHDYLLAYWMGRFHHFLEREQIDSIPRSFSSTPEKP